jgi:hypothetical protein
MTRCGCCGEMSGTVVGWECADCWSWLAYLLRRLVPSGCVLDPVAWQAEQCWEPPVRKGKGGR